jgi:hypothetical protein
VETLLAALVGGLLAIVAGLLVASAADRGERRRWRRDAQLKASTDLLSALQTLVRRMIDVAYLEDKRLENTRTTQVIQAYHEATISWNSAMYAALLVSSPALPERIPGLDQEVDRLLDLAAARKWTRSEFREQRRSLGRLAAEYLNMARAGSGASKIRITTVWTWDSLSSPASTSLPTDVEPDHKGCGGGARRELGGGSIPGSSDEPAPGP